MASNAIGGNRDPDSYPGQHLGLPREGRGSLAPFRTRLTALVVDWAASMALALALFGSGALLGGGWRAWTILGVFFVESALLSALAGGSLGQLATHLAVVRLDSRPLGLLPALARAALVCVVLPALVVGPDRRGLHDVVVGTAVVQRR